MTSNAHRAYESAAGKSDIKDEYNEVPLCAMLIFQCEINMEFSSQVISLGEVRILIGVFALPVFRTRNCFTLSLVSWNYRVVSAHARPFR